MSSFRKADGKSIDSPPTVVRAVAGWSGGVIKIIFWAHILVGITVPEKNNNRMVLGGFYAFLYFSFLAQNDMKKKEL